LARSTTCGYIAVPAAIFSEENEKRLIAWITWSVVNHASLETSLRRPSRSLSKLCFFSSPTNSENCWPLIGSGSAGGGGTMGVGGGGGTHGPGPGP